MTSKQRKALRYQEKSSELFCYHDRLATLERLGILTEHQVTDLQPARVTALKDIYQKEQQGQEWSGVEKLSNNFIAKLLNHDEPLKHCPIFNVEAEEFIPRSVEPTMAEEKTLSGNEAFEETTEALFEIEPIAEKLIAVEEEFSLEWDCDSGISTPTHILMPPDDAVKLEVVPVEEIQFGDITRDDYQRLTSPLIDAPRAVDLLSDIHDACGRIPVAAPKEANAAWYYTTTPLGDLLTHADCSMLVRSIVSRESVAEQRRILSAVRPRVAKLIADAELLDPSYLSSALVNTLADHCYTKTGRVFGNPTSRRKLSLYVDHLRRDLRLRRLGRYLPNSPEYGSFKAAPRVRKKHYE